MHRINVLERRMVALERTVTNNGQYSRKNNVEIDGIPPEIPHDKLQQTVVQLVNSLPGVQPSDQPIAISTNDVEAAHRISRNSDCTIVKFKSRKTVEKVKKRRKGFKDVNYAHFGWKRSTKIYVNDNMCPHLKMLAKNCRSLKDDKEIEDTWCANGQVKIKTNKGKILNIGHELDLFDIFPYYKKFTFDADFCSDVLEFSDLGNYDDRLMETDKEWLLKHLNN